MACSLANFDETDPAVAIDSPRSLKACKQEGVLPQELVYKPIEEFQERALSPRLVKLRYDFFEAKRRDLLAASRKARDSILAEERREAALAGQALDVMAKESGMSKGTILALNGDSLKQERMKMQRAQERERNWLKNALDSELKQLKLMEHASSAAEDIQDTTLQRQQEAARRMKELNDKKAAAEERKQLEAEARMRLEKQIAKEEFVKNKEDVERQAQEAARRQREVYQRQLEEMERKKQAELEKQERKEAAFREQEAKKAEMRAQDLRRTDVREQQKQAFETMTLQKKDERQRRVQKCEGINAEMDMQKRLALMEKQAKEKEREDRMLANRALAEEETSKKSLQQMMKRRMIFEESQRKQEDRRLGILEQQEDNEMRLLEHEQKKERYLDFKRELEGLRTKNKEINVERQRRREAAAREQVAEQVRRKDQKIDAMNLERKKLWEYRKAQQVEAGKARETVRAEIMKQRIQSKYNSRLLEQKMAGMKLAKTPATMSLPNLRRPGSAGPAMTSVANESEVAE